MRFSLYITFLLALIINISSDSPPVGHDGSRVLSGSNTNEVDIPGGTVNNVIAGGTGNKANNAGGGHSSVLGGKNNKVLTEYSSVGGGYGNQIKNGSHSVIAGGKNNKIGDTAASDKSTICGGEENVVDSGDHSFIGGGIYNKITGSYSAIVGGGDEDILYRNIITKDNSIIGSGGNNKIDGNFSGVLSGYGNHIDLGGDYGFIGSGDSNIISSMYSGICGGENNKITASIADMHYNHIGGGKGNYINNSKYSAISGGIQNSIFGDYSAIPGGAYLTINADNSFGFRGYDGTTNIKTISNDNTAAFLDVKFGIGDASPDQILDIYDTTPIIRINDADSGDAAAEYIEFGQNEGGWSRTGWIGDGASLRRELQFSSSSGNYIGFYPEDQNASLTNGTLFMKADQVKIRSRTGPNWSFFVNGSAGGTSSWMIYSDARLKENVHPINNALEKVKSLRGVHFNWRTNFDMHTANELSSVISSRTNTNSFGLVEFKDLEDANRNLHPNNRQLGFIAQEVKNTLPEVVNKEEDGTYTMAVGPMAAVLVEATKELKNSNDYLESQIQSLILRLEKLEKRVNE